MNLYDKLVKLATLEERLRERGVVDVKFHKTEEYPNVSVEKRVDDITAVLEAVLDGRTTPALQLGDSVRVSETLSPGTRCAGAGLTGEYDEEQQESGTTPQ